MVFRSESLGCAAGKLRQRGELIDQLAQRFDRAQNHLAAFADNVGRLRRGPVDMLADALRGERDRA